MHVQLYIWFKSILSISCLLQDSIVYHHIIILCNVDTCNFVIRPIISRISSDDVCIYSVFSHNFLFLSFSNSGKTLVHNLLPLSSSHSGHSLFHALLLLRHSNLHLSQRVASHLLHLPKSILVLPNTN